MRAAISGFTFTYVTFSSPGRMTSTIGSAHTDAAGLSDHHVQQVALADLVNKRIHNRTSAGGDAAGRHTDYNSHTLMLTAEIHLAQRLLTNRFQISNGLHEYLHLHGLLIV